MHAKCAVLALGLLVTASGVVLSHSVLEPEAAQNLLNEIARYRNAAGSEPKREARAEAGFNLGTRGQTLGGLLNQDVNAHGTNQPLTQEAMHRLAGPAGQRLRAETTRRYSCSS